MRTQVCSTQVCNAFIPIALLVCKNKITELIKAKVLLQAEAHFILSLIFSIIHSSPKTVELGIV